jgi:DNA-binding GntR family transcriptional regulator
LRCHGIASGDCIRDLPMEVDFPMQRLNRCRVARRDWRALVQSDRSFHQAIGAAARNAWLARTLRTLHNSALRFWHYAHDDVFGRRVK